MILFRGLLLLLFFGQSMNSWGQPPIPFLMCYEDKQLLPYFAGDGSKVPKKNPGISIEVLQILDQEQPGITLSFRREPWKRCLAMLESGDVNGVIASYKKSREKIGVYPMLEGKPDDEKAFELTKYCLYSKEKFGISWNGNSFDKVNALPVAIPLGYSIISLFQQHNIEVIDVNSSDRGFFLLKNERVSGTATLCESGNRILAQNGAYNDIRQNKISLRIKGSFLLISHQFYNQNTALSHQLWDNIVSINHRVYEQIYQRYSEQ
jgi:polar amino acid transport system substrate-binding protein